MNQGFLPRELTPSADPQEVLELGGHSETEQGMDRSSHSSPTKENYPPYNGALDAADSPPKRDVSMRASPSDAMPSRSPTLSWQRRPNSQSSDLPRSRPLSMIATENAARSPRLVATTEPSSESTSEQPLSREQIAQSLASKDPTWFRQTADRGLNSPAYRRNQVESEDRSDHGLNSSRVQMPGMSRDTSGSEKPLDDPTLDRSPSKSSFSLGSGSRLSEAIGNTGSPLPSSSTQTFAPPKTDLMFETRGLAMSPSQGRISPERLDRPLSPTKGMGGFVQSAMMKRSDSVSKRWSVQSPGLSRGNSVASNMSSSGTATRPGNMSRDDPQRPPSRPTSSHSNTTITDGQRPGTSGSMTSNTTTSTSNGGFIKPSLPASRSQAPAVSNNGRDDSEDRFDRNETTPPTSPSKTMNPRRWSPTKSSWLETALNKPDSPKPKATPPQQPTWMSEITRAKQKNSVDLTHNPPTGPRHEVNIGGLMRSPPLGGLAKPHSVGGLPTGFSSGLVTKGRSESISSQDSRAVPDKPEPEVKTSPASGKPKPAAPPAKDLRGVLKPRQTFSGSSKKDEPEFKSVFGQLRRTQTQNYVAPDELKDNISRGKAALNITGGPKPTERRDEFKDAILKKKEDFKKAQLEGKGVARPASGGSKEAPLPEALMKRNAMGRSGSIVAAIDDRQTSTAMPLKASGPANQLQGKLAGRLNPALAGLLARGPPSAASNTSRSASQTSSERTVSMSTSTTSPDTQEAGPTLTHITKGRARGPRRKAPTAVPAAVTASVETSGSKLLVEPKITSPVTSRTPDPLKKSKSITPPPESSPEVENEQIGSQPTSPRKLNLKRRSQFLQDSPNKDIHVEAQLEPSKPLLLSKKLNTLETPIKSKESAEATSEPSREKTRPETPIKSPSLVKNVGKSSSIQQPESPETPMPRPAPRSAQNITATKTPPKYAAPVTLSQPAHGNRSHERKFSKSNDQETSASVKSAAASWQRPVDLQSAGASPKARSPIKLPTHHDEKAAMIEAGLRSPSPVKANAPIGLGIKIVRDTTPSRSLPTPPAKGRLSSPPSAALATSVSPTKSSSPSVPEGSEASKLLQDFFGQHNSAPEFLADTAAILSARQERGTDIKTLRSSLYLLSGDGKKQLVPTHHERLLFEGNMYICVHAFGNAAGKKVTEVYFWFGDEVPTSTVQGADIFAQREAKAAGGTLVKIQQGKETPEFFQALGGILIIRRGLSNKYDSLAPHILCGRKHHGQIAFDEVDFTPASLCSGFPYLISTQSGKSYLWKGKGSGIDELSCARLIGMDMGLTGDIEEVEDGNEPASFLTIFGVGAKAPKSADHWRLKPNYNKYCGRLFRAESSAKSQVGGVPKIFSFARD